MEITGIDKLFEVRPSELSVYMRPGERSAHMRPIERPRLTCIRVYLLAITCVVLFSLHASE